MLDMDTIKRFINGEINENEFEKNVNGFIDELNKSIAECGENSIIYRDKYGREEDKITASKYIDFARTDLEATKDDDDIEEGNLVRKAAICDMCNNLAHASNLIKDENRGRTSSLFALKVTMIEQIIEECKTIGNECYGKKYDLEKDCGAFAVDIPQHGQISWHLGRKIVRKKIVECKDYDFEIDKTEERNCDFLACNVKYSKKRNLPKHTIKVLDAPNIEEMMKSLCGNTPHVEVKNSEELII